MNSVCPYCKNNLGKEIKRKADCKNCNKTIYVRHGQAVTEREKEIIDWQLYMDFLVPDINQIRVIIEKDLTKRFGKEPSAHDLVWGMFNYIATKLKKISDLETLYNNMATFLESEGKQTQAIQLQKQAFKMKILDLKNGDLFTGIRIKNKEDDFVCDVCKNLNNKVFTLDKAYKDIPLPVDNCKNKQCRCWPDVITKYDTENGNDYSSNNNTITIELKRPIKKKGLINKLLGL